ncbi:MAG TPA: isopentenyl transferase family protein, partial [Candidatus Polarisedimenticolaceae bacterium]|nr:isopentenyl transferase family protein [Candidatus Polarisedimenticolaceae bacterium]
MRALRRFDRARPDLLSRPPAGDGQPVPGPGAPEGLLADLARPRLLVVLGPTGTGKSELAVRLAERLGGEIVNCDALQVYRGLDAATAKPSAGARRGIPHHLIDVADPRRDFSLADYVRQAEAAIAGIAARGRVPIVAGGTGLYLRGLLRGIVD